MWGKDSPAFPYVSQLLVANCTAWHTSFVLLELQW